MKDGAETPRRFSFGAEPRAVASGIETQVTKPFLCIYPAATASRFCNYAPVR
jgi:hypothetical protein